MVTASDPEFAKLPPRVVAKALKLPGPLRREYVQTLIGVYDYKLRHLDRIARDAVESAPEQWTKWRQNMRVHLEACVPQLEALRDV